jgi:glycosyltransferase involved in cell wall biosynthesis
MSQHLPTVSVVIPVYNTGLWTCDALDSVLAQTHPAHEIILVDDGSEAATGALLDRAAAAHPALVQVARHPVNRGLSAARNTGLRAATGALIVFLDSDDVLADPGVLADIADQHAQTDFDMMRLRLRFWKHDPITGAERRWDDPVDSSSPPLSVR